MDEWTAVSVYCTDEMAVVIILWLVVVASTL